MAVQRAEDKTLAMQARAGAIDELMAGGALDDPMGMGKDSITAELEQMASQAEVESSLAAMKDEIGSAQKKPEIEH
jgi:phage shock protein A